MPDEHERRLLGLWALLIALAFVSAAATPAAGPRLGSLSGNAVVIALAFYKARIVFLEFMEVRRAPLALRVAVEAWIIIIPAAILAMPFAGGLAR
jgi:hypothetical protein